MSRPPFHRRHSKKLVALALVVGAPLTAHVAVGVATGLEPPAVGRLSGEPKASSADPDTRLLGGSYARHRGKVLEVRLTGTPEELGYEHARLLYPEMVADEGALYAQFERYVPLSPLRALIMDISRVQFRHVDRGMPEDRRREVAAEAAGFAPDPFTSVMPTYQRFVFLQALYDISLSFEHSPLLGCTSFALTGGAFEGGHVVLARNFDFEAGPIFDEGKAVFLVLEKGKVPYASVSWPGLVGAFTGMNAAGVALVVHGGRARTPRQEGEPVTQTMRDVLGEARTTAEALGLLERRAPMVSHLVMVVDPSGDVAVAERAPGAAMFVRRGSGKVPLTNHFEGPLRGDPANLAIETVTSTRPRRLRLDELLRALPAGATPAQVVSILRDKKGVGGVPLPLGNRRAIDALIATHGVVMDVTARALWVSEGPHLAGRFIRFDLARLLDPGYEPGEPEPLETLAPDPLAQSGAYEAWVRAGSLHPGEQ